jgi:dUTP pyrophosphatase
MDLLVRRLHPNAVLPHYATAGAAAFDLTAISLEILPVRTYGTTAGRKCVYGTGLAVGIPPGWAGFVYARSSVHKTGMQLSNCVGIIDSDYRGEIQVVFHLRSVGEELYRVGDRIAQMLVVPVSQLQLVEVDALGETDRGSGSFGSTGR